MCRVCYCDHFNDHFIKLAEEQKASYDSVADRKGVKKPSRTFTTIVTKTSSVEEFASCDMAFPSKMFADLTSCLSELVNGVPCG